MNTFCVSDWHLGENRFELMCRPFTTPSEHINTLIRNHNSVVKPDDLVYVNGDVCYQKAPEHLPLVKKFNGRKILVRGNHDKVFTDEQLKPYFDDIITEGDGIELDVNGIPCYITHYPTQGKKDRFNLVGHIHAAWKYQLNCFNVGVDVNHFRPVNINTIPFHFKAICEFYDDDVWVAYDDINVDWLKCRGKPGTYFKPQQP